MSKIAAAKRSTGNEFLLVDAENATDEPIPSILRPHWMYGNSTSSDIDMAETVAGEWGATRLDAPFGATDFHNAANETEMVNRTIAYFSQDEVVQAVTRGCGYGAFLTPPYLATGTLLYSNQNVPTDLSEGGAYQNAVTLHVQTAIATLGANYTVPRDASGNVDLRLPGLFWECGNEWGNIGTTNRDNSFLTWHAFFRGILAADPDSVICGPNVVRWNVPAVSGNSTPYLQSLYAYMGANNCKQHVAGWHNFQAFIHDLPTLNIEGAAAIRGWLTEGGMSSSMHQIIGELINQHGIGTAEGQQTRADYPAAAWYASSLLAHWQAGVHSGSMATLLKQGFSLIPDSNPFAENGDPFSGYGMLTRSNTRIPVSSFSIMKLFSLWSGGKVITLKPQSQTPSGLRYFAAKKDHDIIVLAVRWQPSVPNKRLVLRVRNPGRTFIDARIYRFDVTKNNVIKVFTDTVGTDTQKALAAQAVGLDPSYETLGSEINTFDFIGQDTMMLHFRYS